MYTLQSFKKECLETNCSQLSWLSSHRCWLLLWIQLALQSAYFLCSNMPGGPGRCFDSHIPRALKKNKTPMFSVHLSTSHGPINSLHLKKSNIDSKHVWFGKCTSGFKHVYHVNISIFWGLAIYTSSKPIVRKQSPSGIAFQSFDFFESFGKVLVDFDHVKSW